MAKIAAKQNGLCSLSLKAIRLVSYGANVLKPVKELVKDCPLEVAITMSGKASQNADKMHLTVDISFAVNFIEKPKPQKDALAIFNGTYQLLYGSDSPCDIEEHRMGLFIKNTSVVDIWPYWRELVHETSARMGMSVSPLPCTVNFTDSPEEFPAEEQQSQEDAKGEAATKGDQ